MPPGQGGERVAPSSRVPAGPRPDELASLYRKIAELQTELSDAEARLQRAVSESAGADEMVGQMLARVGEVEARLHESEAAHAESIEALEDAQDRTAKLAAELDLAQVESNRLRAELLTVQQEAEIVVPERDALHEEVAALRARVTREKEERETLGLRVGELSHVCDERDAALHRLEQLEAELCAARAEIAALHARHEGGPGAASQRQEGGDDVAAVRTERDALATEARHLRAAVEGVGRVLAELEQNLASDRATLNPDQPQPVTMGETPKPPPRAIAGGDPAESTVRPRPAEAEVVDQEPEPEPEEEEDTKVFGAREMMLVRETARSSPKQPRRRG